MFFLGSSAKLSSAGLVQAEMPVGTPEYLAPEVLQGIEATESKTKSRSGSSRSVLAQPHPYGTECDFWSLGIVAYEMVFGKTPFKSDQLATTYQNILLHKKYFKYPDNVEVSEGKTGVLQKNQSIYQMNDTNRPLNFFYLLTVDVLCLF